MRWLLYGANGYTGELIAREAVARGERPILAGRSREKIEPLARKLGCEWRAFDVEHADLSGVDLVLHCAGPFMHTSRPMVAACLAQGAHYLDITGEIAVFESIFRRDADAKAKNVALIPGVGFDVVPTDCLAAKLHAKLPDANDLILAFFSKSGLSRGTLKTMIEGAGWGGAIRRDGKIVRVPQLYDVREIAFPSGPRMAMTIPWGDVSTAFRSTGIPNIRVYNAQSPRALAKLKRTKKFLPLLRFKPFRAIALKFADKQQGTNAEVRATAKTELWGCVSNASGEHVSMTMTVAEGYAFTIVSALAAVKEMERSTRRGALTPSMAFGADFVDRVSPSS